MRTDTSAKNTSTSKLDIVSFESEYHLEGAIRSIMNVRASDPSYPPPHDAEYSYESMGTWLMEEDPFMRVIAMVDGKVAGHISLTPAHPYLENHLLRSDYVAKQPHGFLEISKFFVDPAFQKHGVGRILFNNAIESAFSAEFQPALAVIETSTKAIHFYKHWGMESVGEFNGIHGKNFVFVAPVPSEK
jgi:GNAT superfamily N-acetyltransferase